MAEYVGKEKDVGQTTNCDFPKKRKLNGNGNAPFPMKTPLPFLGNDQEEHSPGFWLGDARGSLASSPWESLQFFFSSEQPTGGGAEGLEHLCGLEVSNSQGPGHLSPLALPCGHSCLFCPLPSLILPDLRAPGSVSSACSPNPSPWLHFPSICDSQIVLQSDSLLSSAQASTCLLSHLTQVSISSSNSFLPIPHPTGLSQPPPIIWQQPHHCRSLALS